MSERKWYMVDGGPGGPSPVVYSDGNYAAVEHGRPVVVIDPEDREQVERLVTLYNDGECDPAWVDAMRAALRKFTEPKPDEPTGLGAVVEDVEGERWVRVNVATGTQEWRCCDAIGEFRRWGGVNAVRVLSEGVSEE